MVDPRVELSLPWGIIGQAGNTVSGFDLDIGGSTSGETWTTTNEAPYTHEGLGSNQGALVEHIANKRSGLLRDFLMTRILVKRTLKLASKVAVFGDEFTFI